MSVETHTSRAKAMSNMWSLLAKDISPVISDVATIGSKYSRWLSSKKTEVLYSQATATRLSAKSPLSSCVTMPFMSTLGSDSRMTVPSPNVSLASTGKGPFGSPKSRVESLSVSSQLATLDSASISTPAPAAMDDGWFRSSFDTPSVSGSSANVNNTENSGLLSNDKSIRSFPENRDDAPMDSSRPFPVPKSSASISTPPPRTNAPTVSPSAPVNSFDGPTITSVSVVARRSMSCNVRCTIVASVPDASATKVGANRPASYVATARPLVPFHPELYMEKSVVVDMTGEAMVTRKRAIDAIMTMRAT